jgi:hypothetical protein
MADRPAISFVLYATAREGLQQVYVRGLVQNLAQIARLLPGWRAVLHIEEAVLYNYPLVTDVILLCREVWGDILEVRGIPPDYEGNLMLARFLPLRDAAATVVASRDIDSHMTEEDARLLAEMRERQRPSLIYREYRMTGACVAMGGGVALDAAAVRRRADAGALLDRLFDYGGLGTAKARGNDELVLSEFLLALEGRTFPTAAVVPSCEDTLLTRMTDDGTYFVSFSSMLGRWDDGAPAPRLMGIATRRNISQCLIDQLPAQPTARALFEFALAALDEVSAAPPPTDWVR